MLFTAYRGEKDKIMTKRFALVLAVLMVASLILTACGTESRDNAEKYVKAVMKGDAAKADGLACEANQDTQALIDWYAGKGINDDGLDLKFDIGKGNNQKEIIVTGEIKYGGEDDREYEMAQSVRAADVQRFVGGPEPADPDEKIDTRLVLTMKEEDGDWCVESVETGGVAILGGEASEGEATTEEAAEEGEGAAEETTEGAAEESTEETDAEGAKEATPEAAEGDS